MNEVVGHKTFRNPDGSFRHEPLYADEAAELWASAEAAQARRAEQMPDEQAAIRAMFEAWQRLKELGWREAMYCPKDGSYFDVIEPGSTVIHRCNYYGEWPTGSYWIDGDSPSHPVLFRLPLQRNYSGITAGAEKSSQVFDSGAAGPTRTGDLLITNQGAETAETLVNQQDMPSAAPAEGAQAAKGESSTCEGVTAGLPAWNEPCAEIAAKADARIAALEAERAVVVPSTPTVEVMFGRDFPGGDPHPVRTVRMTFRHPTLGDGYGTPVFAAAHAEFYAADPRGLLMQFTASNGCEITVENLDGAP